MNFERNPYAKLGSWAKALRADPEPDAARYEHSLTAAGSENSSARRTLPVLLGSGGLRQDLVSQGAELHTTSRGNQGQLRGVAWKLTLASPPLVDFTFSELLLDGCSCLRVLAPRSFSLLPSHLVMSLQQPRSLLSTGDLPLAISDYF